MAARAPLPFPFVSAERFAQGCEDLVALVERSGRAHDWQLTPGDQGLRIVRLLTHDSTIFRDATHESFDPVEESDEEELPLAQHTARSPRVEFSIVLSPVYRVPVLYFSLHDVPASSHASVEQIQDLLVPPHFSAQIKSVGVMGGISMTVSLRNGNDRGEGGELIAKKNHPVTDMPVFFVHPCNTATALEETASTPEPSPLQYMLQWLGIVGACVGLHLPMDLALQADRTS